MFEIILIRTEEVQVFFFKLNTSVLQGEGYVIQIKKAIKAVRIESYQRTILLTLENNL